MRVIIYSISYLRATHARRYWRLDQRLDSQESSQGRGIPRIPSQTLHYNPSRQRGFLFRVEGDPRLESGEVNSSSYYNFLWVVSLLRFLFYQSLSLSLP